MTLTRTATDALATRRAASRTGTVLTVLVAAFLLFDSVPKLLSFPPVVEACAALGFPAGTVPVIGATLLACLVLYLVPRTALLGAVLYLRSAQLREIVAAMLGRP